MPLPFFEKIVSTKETQTDITVGKSFKAAELMKNVGCPIVIDGIEAIHEGNSVEQWEGENSKKESVDHNSFPSSGTVKKDSPVEKGVWSGNRRDEFRAPIIYGPPESFTLPQGASYACGQTQHFKPQSDQAPSGLPEDVRPIRKKRPVYGPPEGFTLPQHTRNSNHYVRKPEIDNKVIGVAKKAGEVRKPDDVKSEASQKSCMFGLSESRKTLFSLSRAHGQMVCHDGFAPSKFSYETTLLPRTNRPVSPCLPDIGIERVINAVRSCGGFALKDHLKKAYKEMYGCDWNATECGKYFSTSSLQKAVEMYMKDFVQVIPANGSGKLLYRLINNGYAPTNQWTKRTSLRAQDAHLNEQGPVSNKRLGEESMITSVEAGVEDDLCDSEACSTSCPNGPKIYDRKKQECHPQPSAMYRRAPSRLAGGNLNDSCNSTDLYGRSAERRIPEIKSDSFGSFSDQPAASPNETQRINPNDRYHDLPSTSQIGDALSSYLSKKLNVKDDTTTKRKNRKDPRDSFVVIYP